jgi:glycosyltransferase involved in cell wall biosynthesis
MRIAVWTFAFAEVAASQVAALEEFCDVTLFVPTDQLSRAFSLRHVVPVGYSPQEGVVAKCAAVVDAVRELRKLEPDVLHLQGVPPVLLPVLPVLMTRRLVVSLHDPVLHSGEENRITAITQLLAARAARKVIFMSKAMETAAFERYRWLCGKTAVIPLGVHDSYVEGSERRPPELDDAERLVLLFGRLSPYKGVEDLLDAFAIARSRVSQTLVLAGRQLYPIRGVSRATADPRIVAMNRYIADDELRYLFRRSDLVVLPYRDATQSAVLMTAYAFGKPVIVTRVGGLPEMVVEGRTGFVVPPGDPAQLASCLIEALGDSARLAEMGRAALAFASSAFSWREIARRHVDVYEEAARGGRA